MGIERSLYICLIIQSIKRVMTPDAIKGDQGMSSPMVRAWQWRAWRFPADMFYPDNGVQPVSIQYVTSQQKE